MGRETKFRGKRLDNGEWQIGDLITFCDAQGNIHRCFIHLRMSPVGFTEPALASTVCLYEVDPNTVGQFTGLIDKTKTEIYEGDIVSWHEILHCTREFDGTQDLGTSIGVVEFRITKWSSGFNIKQIKGDNPFYDEMGTNFRFDELEIIGNIYENKELLK